MLSTESWNFPAANAAGFAIIMYREAVSCMLLISRTNGKTAGRCQIRPTLRNGLPWHIFRKRTFTETGRCCWDHRLQLYRHFCQLLGTVCRPDRTHCLTSVLGSLPVRLPRKDRCRNGSGLRRISGISECMGKTDDCLLSGKPKNEMESGSGTLR